MKNSISNLTNCEINFVSGSGAKQIAEVAAEILGIVFFYGAAYLLINKFKISGA